MGSTFTKCETPRTHGRAIFSLTEKHDNLGHVQGHRRDLHVPTASARALSITLPLADGGVVAAALHHIDGVNAPIRNTITITCDLVLQL